jgi:hypothetical protein
MPPPALIEVAGAVETYIDTMPDEWKAKYASELEGMEQAWSKMRQEVADKHVTVYTRKSKKVGYVFCGAQNEDKMTMKWIVCGNPKFTEEYQNVLTKDDEKAFNKRYKKVSSTTAEIDALDSLHNANRFQRVCKFSAPKKDSGWIKV